MDDSKASVAERIELFQGDVDKLSAYLPWLIKNSGAKLWNTYTPENSGPGTLKVPVYDSTLLAFVKAVQKTRFYNKYYVYTYSKYRIRDYKDELRLIEKAELKDMEVLGDILARYIQKGMVKGAVWNEGVEYGVYEKVITKMKEIIEFYTRPGK